MARFTGSKNKISRGLGFDIFNRGEKIKKMNVLPGGKRPKKISEFGRQLKSKQTVKASYGVLERQFRNYVRKALRQRGNPGDNLVVLLERRLDNIVYRLGWAKTRPAARQMVTHGHVLINGKRMSVPSYEVKPGDEIGLDKIFTDKEIIIEEKVWEREPLSWLLSEESKAVMTKLPESEEINLPVPVSDIIEYYSR